MVLYRAEHLQSIIGEMNETQATAGTKSSIAVLIPMVWGVRNVIYSGVLENLATAGVDVHLLLRDYDPSVLEAPAYDDFSSAASCRTLIRPDFERQIRGRSFLRDVIHSAFAKRNEIGSYDIFRRWRKRDYTARQLWRGRLVELLGTLAQPAAIFFKLYEFYDNLCHFEYDLEPIRQQLQEIAPDLLLSTVNVEALFERPYVLAARDLGIPIVNAILSFDNLTSKPAHLLYDHYLVWSRRMKEQLLAFYPQVAERQVTITGTPQFDFHRRPDFLWTQQETLQHLGLPPDAQYFLYAGGSQSLTPAEPELVTELTRWMEKDELLSSYWLVVRTHPLDDWNRWGATLSSSDRVVLSQAWNTEPDEEGWALTTPEDQARLVSTLAHAAGCLNIASTVTLDAAILDRPVIGIRFEDEDDAPTDIIYEGYDTDHFRPLVESGGLQVAHSWSELLSLMHQAITEPGRDKKGRARMVAQECGAVDGHAAERVVDALLTCLQRW
jgi:hypothetical protein